MMSWYYVYNEKASDKELYCAKVDSEKAFRDKFKKAKQHDVPQGLTVFSAEEEPKSGQYAGNPKIVKL